LRAAFSALESEEIMRVPSSVSGVLRIVLVLLLVAGSVALVGGSKSPYSPHEKAFWADKALVDFVLPGLAITINSAKISSAGVISVTYTLTDPTGLPLDAAGATTPGVVSLAYVAAYIPKGQEQYVAYTTGSATGKVLGTITRPDFELGGTATQVGPGQYQYTFIAQAPAGFDATATTTVAVDGNRNLSAFNLGTSYAGATFNFVPNGSPVTVTRDVIRTQSCNGCHYDLAFHGGYAHGMPMCVMCHQPQNADPVTGNTLDLKVFAHKLHMGSQLPSVIGTATTPGVPYEIIGYMNSVNNFSTVIDPANPQRCEVCHSQTTGAAQAKAFMLEPTRAACGACHDDVNFATGANHPGGFQLDDTECANCHIPQGETPFDASILGAHVVANDTAAAYPPNPDTLITSVVINITGITNGLAGQKPVVAFTVKDENGKPLAMSLLEDLNFNMAGPTTDYGYTSFGSDVTTPGYVTEDGTAATCDASSNCTYTFLHAVPAAATGSYAIGVESERLENILTGTNAAQQVESGTPNQVVYFSVDGSPVLPRRTVVQKANCNQCHINLQAHGARRNDPEYCVLCHNPSDTDAAARAVAQVAADKALPPQTVNMAVMFHRLHDGVNVVPAGGKPFIVVGHGGSHHDFSGVLFPVMSPSGEATYMQDCSMCHVNGSEQKLPTGLNLVVDPQGWINPVQPDSSACSGCHVSKPEAAHFLANTDALGESCDVCHAAGAQFAVDAVHVQ
jgi:OmcA/MtrC family decaheme c-type cytochrome